MQAGKEETKEKGKQARKEEKRGRKEKGKELRQGQKNNKGDVNKLSSFPPGDSGGFVGPRSADAALLLSTGKELSRSAPRDGYV